VRGLLWFAGPDGRKRAKAQVCGVGDMKLSVAAFESLTYRELWDTYVEPNLPPEEPPSEADAKAAAVAAALTLGCPDIRPLLESLSKDPGP